WGQAVGSCTVLVVAAADRQPRRARLTSRSTATSVLYVVGKGRVGSMDIKREGNAWRWFSVTCNAEVDRTRDGKYVFDDGNGGAYALCSSRQVRPVEPLPSRVEGVGASRVRASDVPHHWAARGLHRVSG